ncbi:MAG: hypothetical protein ACKO3N_08660, partial [Verrucomicrobiota bacterium]
MTRPTNLPPHRAGARFALFVAAAVAAAAGPSAVALARPGGPSSLETFIHQYCVDCHDGAARKGGLDLESLAAGD